MNQKDFETLKDLIAKADRKDICFILDMLNAEQHKRSYITLRDCDLMEHEQIAIKSNSKQIENAFQTVRGLFPLDIDEVYAR